MLPVMILFGGALSNFYGGFTIQSLLYSFWEPVIAIGIIIKFIDIFRSNFNKPTKTSTFFTTNSYAVYIIHTPVVIFVAYCFSQLNIPSIIKFLLVGNFSILVSFSATNLLRKIKPIKDIL